ncbi:WD40-repeat-containing domain protein [Suillus clintonianus]|uniref:WD40-repeat-containing domain protein n=1 Tax=Suillus clintonianus TaxID=1904413 RepID=UPI001B875022|nr:WD40-repeat-containing domain protein [Suillus clintonianus]KAG2153933.1 WD40-repeat-containing domain protein [Suillus clintonianus]
MGQPLGEPFRGHTKVVQSVSFSLDGTHIASGSRDNTVRLWDAATGQPLGEPFRGHTSAVCSVSFSPDGTRIVSGSNDHTVRLWDAAMQQHTKIHSSAHSLDIVPRKHESPVVSTSTQKDHFICFSSTLRHALRNPADLFEGNFHHDSDSTPFLLHADGWMMGPNRRLLFWVPPASRYAFYSPGTAMVIPRGHTELDLSTMEHGTRWSNCRDA